MKLVISLVCIFIISILNTNAQPKVYTQPVGFGHIIDNIDTWTIEEMADRDFFVSRVPLKNRFENTGSQFNPSLNNNRQFVHWHGVNEDSEHYALVRNEFDCDNYSAWSYTDVLPLWRTGATEVSGAFADAAHKHGVRVMGTWFLPFASYDPNNEVGIRMNKILSKDENGNFKYTIKFLKIIKSLGLDGIAINQELSGIGATLADDWQAWMSDLYEKAPTVGMPQFFIFWYDAQANDGYRSFPNKLYSNNKDYFHKDGKVVTDGFMLNYNWTYTNSYLSTSVATATSFEGRTGYEVYPGVYTGANGFGTGWTYFAQNEISLCFWSGRIWKERNRHNPVELNNIEAQEKYQRLLEVMMSGGNQNVANMPTLHDTPSLEDSYINQFHGLATFFPARSTITELPFVTRFNLGNGQWFRYDGQVAFDAEWYNMGMQDLTPSWRWWITDDSNQQSTAIKASFCFDDAWFGGTSLKLEGSTSSNVNVRLFKTKLNVQSGQHCKIRYKLPDAAVGTDSHLSLHVALEGNESQLIKFPLGNTNTQGWNQTIINLTDNGITAGQTLALIGLSVNGSPSNYEVLIGEISLNNPTETYQPKQPHSLNLVMKKELPDSVDIRLSWQLTPDVPVADRPVYNQEVGAWYYNIYIKEDGQIKKVNSTASWATYIVNLPIDSNASNISFGVSAVAPDGETQSPITWIVYKESESPGLKFEHGIVNSVNDNWTTITLNNVYDNMVVVATPVIGSIAQKPVVTRIRNASNDSFELKVQNPSNEALSNTYPVHYFVVEEGVYTQTDHGITMEAVKFTSTDVNYKDYWDTTGLQRTYQNSYTSPVILGQVMTENDTQWSSFWACGTDRTEIPTANDLFVGKHVGQDTNKTRADETIGYIVLESGSGIINSTQYATGVGQDIVQGIEWGNTHTYSSFEGVTTALLSSAAMDGGDGGWPLLIGAAPVQDTGVTLTIDEDQILDSERKHTTEQVAYLFLGNSVNENLKAANLDQLKTKTEETQIAIFPNPLKKGRELNMQLSTTSTQKLQIKIYSLLGALLQEQSFSTISGSNNIKIPTHQFTEGTYIIRIVDPASATIIKTTKLIITQ